MSIDCCKSYVGKQIIGLNGGGATPPLPICLWGINWIDSTCLGFTDPLWDFNGFGVDFNAYVSSIGGWFAQDGSPNNCFPEYTNGDSSISFYYYGVNPPPDLTIEDPSFGTFQLPYNNVACSIGCLTTNSIRPSNSPYEWCVIVPANPANLALYGGNLDFSLGAFPNQQILQKVLDSYQPQATVSVQDDGSGFFTITFTNFIYNPSALTNALQLIYSSGFGVDYYDLIEC